MCELKGVDCAEASWLRPGKAQGCPQPRATIMAEGENPGTSLPAASHSGPCDTWRLPAVIADGLMRASTMLVSGETLHCAHSCADRKTFGYHATIGGKVLSGL